MRRSMSRTPSRYSSTLRLSAGPISRLRSATFPVTESRIERSRAMRARRTAGSVLPLSPNIRSNTTRGLFSIGSGVVRLRQQMVFV